MPTAPDPAPSSLDRRVYPVFVRLLTVAVWVVVPFLVFRVVYGGVGGPDPAVKFAQNEDPYARALRITDRRFGTPRADVGPAPLYDGQDEAGTLLNDWQRADSLKYFRAR